MESQYSFFNYESSSSLTEKYENLLKDIDSLIIDIKNIPMPFIFQSTIKIFFEMCNYLDRSKINNLFDKLSMLYHKLKKIQLFNLLVSYYREIKGIHNEIEKSFNDVGFTIRDDLIINPVFNENNTCKFRINIKSTSLAKYKYLKLKIEEYFDAREDNLIKNDFIIGNFEEGYTFENILKDKFLYLNSGDVLKEMQILLLEFGIYYNTKNSWWYNEDNIRKIPKTEEEKQKRLEEKQKKIIDENTRKLKFKNVIKNLQKDELIIRKKFYSKKNTSKFKQAFFDLKNIILSNEEIKNKLINILPYGSTTQFTYNANSDLEISLFTKNYEKIDKNEISEILQKIEKIIIENYTEKYTNVLIRETRRTILLVLKDKILNIEIEINCNNFFSLMNSNLIRNYLIYDARVLILINTIKDWSKIKKINSNGEGYLSSYCYTLMTIFFLQKINKPLLPVISSSNDLKKIKIYEKEYFIEKQLLQSSDLMQNWHTYNKEDTVSTLLIKWMIFYLYLFDEKQYCIDISNENNTFRYDEAKYLSYSIDQNKLSAYCFIDMFDYTYNPGAYMRDNSYNHENYIRVLKESLKSLLGGKSIFVADVE